MPSHVGRDLLPGKPLRGGQIEDSGGTYESCGLSDLINTLVTGPGQFIIPITLGAHPAVSLGAPTNHSQNAFDLLPELIQLLGAAQSAVFSITVTRRPSHPRQTRGNRGAADLPAQPKPNPRIRLAGPRGTARQGPTTAQQSQGPPGPRPKRGGRPHRPRPPEPPHDGSSTRRVTPPAQGQRQRGSAVLSNVNSAVKGSAVLSNVNSAVAEKTLPQSHDQNLFHTDSPNSIDAEEIQLTNASDSPTQFDINDCNTNDLLNTCHPSSETPADASSPLPAFTPATNLDRCLGQMRQSSQDQVSDCTLLKSLVHVVENQSTSVDLSTHGANNVHMRDRVLALADESRDPERNVEQMNVEEQNKISDAETDYVDETDGESDERMEASQSSGEKKLRHRLFLTTAIDPGMKFTTYIALNTPQRHEKYIKARTLAFTSDQQTVKMKLPAACVNPKTGKEQQKHNCGILTRDSLLKENSVSRQLTETVSDLPC
nr:uncharacterized protein LOC111833388 [Paramormyrops kingsleyae]